MQPRRPQTNIIPYLEFAGKKTHPTKTSSIESLLGECLLFKKFPEQLRQINTNHAD